MAERDDVQVLALLEVDRDFGQRTFKDLHRWAMSSGVDTELHKQAYLAKGQLLEDTACVPRACQLRRDALTAPRSTRCQPSRMQSRRTFNVDFSKSSTEIFGSLTSGSIDCSVRRKVAEMIVSSSGLQLRRWYATTLREQVSTRASSLSSNSTHHPTSSSTAGT